MKKIIFRNQKYLYFELLIVFSSLYLTQILPISPFYFGFVFGIGFLVLTFSFIPSYKFLKLSTDEKIIYSVLFFLSFHIIVNAYVNKVPIKYPLLTVLSFLFFSFSFMAKTIPIDVIKKSLIVFKNTTFILLFVECVCRLAHPEITPWILRTKNYFYMYKHSSIMFFDTNETGFFILSFLSFLVYLKNRNIIRISKKEMIIGFIFLVLSFSRAAIFGFLVFIVYQFIFKKLPRYFKIFAFSLCPGLLVFIISYFMKDGSFLTKIEIYHNTYLYLSKLDMPTLFFGIGINNSIGALGRFGHNYLSLYSIEYGLIGLFLFLLFITLVYVKQRKTVFLLMPYLITGLSFVSYFLPFFYLYLGLIYSFEQRGDLICKNNEC